MSRFLWVLEGSCWNRQNGEGEDVRGAGGCKCSYGELIALGEGEAWRGKGCWGWWRWEGVVQEPGFLGIVSRIMRTAGAWLGSG